ncbi:MAG: adenosylmethionine--8-amino-7-oxononanoate transaminase [Thiotrichales bacterium]
MTQDWISFDQKHVWHPYTAATSAQPLPAVASANGVYFQLTDGRRLVDGMSSWWAAIHGYNHPQLNTAVTDQVGRMAHVMFGGLTHEPAARLAETLLRLTPSNLQHVFFADSGSVAVEVAMKMAIQYWAGRGEPLRKRFLTVRNGYHGDTFGAMSVCDPVNGMHQLFRDSVVQQIFAPAPALASEPDTGEDLEGFSNLLKAHEKEIAAVILEPLVQGAGGMRIYRASYLREVANRCRESGVLLILDEIATGFGRTGTLFALEQADVRPDILCVGKALTGGYMTLAATLTSSEIAQKIQQSESGALMHGPTYMGNPLACAVAQSSIKLLESQPWQKTVQAIEYQLKEALSTCRELPLVKDVRVKGAIGVIELNSAGLPKGLQEALINQGVWLRPFRNLVYMMPPYIIRPNELSKLTNAVYTCIKNQSQNH